MTEAGVAREKPLPRLVPALLSFVAGYVDSYGIMAQTSQAVRRDPQPARRYSFCFSGFARFCDLPTGGALR